MGLYDQYKLENSTGIRKFQGSTTPELMMVGQQLQKQYDVGQNYDDMLGQMIKDSSAAEFDKPVLQQLKAEYAQRIGARAQKGDYENMWRDTMIDSRNFVGDYKHIAENQQRVAAYQKNLQDELEKKDGLIRSPETMNKLIAESMQQGGLKKDPNTGEWTNQFKGITPAREIDIPQWVDKALDHFAPQVLGSKVKRINGDYYETIGSETKRITPDRINKVLDAAKALDPEWGAYVRQKARLDTMGLDRVDDKTALQAYGTGLTSEMMDASRASGRPIGDVVRAYESQKVMKNLDKLAEAYAVGKYQVNDYKGEHLIDSETEAAGRQAVSNMAGQRLLAPAPDTKLEEKERDLGHLENTVQQLGASIAGIDAQIKRAGPGEKKVLEAQKQAMQDHLASRKAIIEGAQNTVAREMGYTEGYKEFETKVVDKTLDTYIQPIGGIGTNGKQVGITKEALKDIIKNKAYSRISGRQQSSGMGYGAPQIGGNADYYEVQTPKGIVKVEAGQMDKMLEPIQQVMSAKQTFDTNLKTEIKNNADNYAMKPMQMSLSDQESKDLKQAIMGNPSGHAFFQPGSTERIADSDLPKDFDIDNVQLMQKSGSIYLTGHEKSTEKGKTGTPTGKTYNIQVTPGSNYGRYIAGNLVQAKKYLSPDMVRAASILAGFTYTGDILNLQNNEPLVIRQDNKLWGTVKRERYESPTLAGQSRYVLYDADGTLLKEADDASEIDRLVQDAIQRKLKDEQPKKP